MTGRGDNLDDFLSEHVKVIAVPMPKRRVMTVRAVVDASAPIGEQSIMFTVDGRPTDVLRVQWLVGNAGLAYLCVTVCVVGVAVVELS